MTVGNGFICEGARALTYGPDDTGITCGTGAGAFDIFDQGTHNQHGIRFYNKVCSAPGHRDSSTTSTTATPPH